MAAGPWVLYNEAKKYLMDGTIDIDGASWRMGLYTSASNANTATLSAKSELTGEVTEANGYSSSGKALTGIIWGVGASASEYRFTADPTFWSANAGDIVNAKFAVIFDTISGKVLCRSALSTSQFTITSGNRLTVTPSANGIFELN